MLTGTLPHEHGVHTYSRGFESVSREDTFLADLADSGFTTVGVSANRLASAEFGFDSLFDRFHEVTAWRRHPEGLDVSAYVSESDTTGIGRYLDVLAAALRHDHPAASLKNALETLVHEHTRDGPLPKLVDDGGRAVLRTARREVVSEEGPTVVFCNLMDAHGPLQHHRGLDSDMHDAPNEWSSNDRDVWDLMETDREAAATYWRIREDVYAATVDYLDRIVADFVDEMQSRTERPTTVIVTADHGENHAEAAANGLANHKSSLSEALLDVPCYVVVPAEWDADEVLPAPDMGGRYFSHLKLGTLVSLAAGADVNGNADANDLLRDRVPAELVGMSAGPDPPPVVDRAFYERSIRCVYDGNRKIEWDSLGRCTEYRLFEDRPSHQEEERSLDNLPDWATAFFETPLEEYTAAARAAATDREISDATRDQLENLGYR